MTVRKIPTLDSGNLIFDKFMPARLASGAVAPLVASVVPDANLPARLNVNGINSAIDTRAGDAAIAAFMLGSAGPSESRKALAKSLAVPGQLVSVLRRGRADAVLALLGDSTGNETTEWFYMLLQWIGTKFPAYTIQYRLWDDTTQAYLTPTTVQTGTSVRVLTVYNGSVPGAAHDYSFAFGNQARFVKMLPVAPTTVITSYGYNSVTTTYRAEALELSRWVRGYYPKAEYIAVAQPPKGNTDSDYANSWLRSADVRAVALANGFGIIDPAQAFSDYGNFTTDLIGADGIHPNTAGSAIWRDEAKRYFDPETPSVMPRTATPVVDRLWVPASQFVTTLNTPTVGFTAANVPAYNFGPTNLEIIAATADIPPSWDSANVYALWSTAGGSTLNVVFTVDWLALTDGVAVPVSGAVPSAFTVGATQTVAATTNVASRQTKVHSKERFVGGRPLVFRVRRLGNDAADTYASTFHFYGLLIERAE